METSFDETDYINLHQVVTAFQEGKRITKVICAVTDVLVLLCHTYKPMNMNAEVLLKDFKKHIISIHKSVEESFCLTFCPHTFIRLLHNPKEEIKVN